MKDIGIYIHIPFCERKCAYCNFYSLPYDESTLAAYVNELLTEIKKTAGRHLDKRVRTVYFGGGTPGLLSYAQVESILDAVIKYYRTELVETTIEINPNSAERIREYAKAGFKRLSVGVQSLNDNILRKLGRLHNAEDAMDCLDKANYYFDNISADLIIGADGRQDIANELALILPRTTHLSCYMLKVEDETPLQSIISAGKATVATDDEVVTQYEKLYRICTERGFYRYEVSNFAKLGSESKHNSSYWKMNDYLGFGASAHSYADGERYLNVSDLKQYIGGCHSGNNRQIVERKYTLNDEKVEFVMLALRTTGGLSVPEFNARFNGDFFNEYGKRVNKMSGYLTITPKRVSIRPQYFLVQNSIIFELL